MRGETKERWMELAEQAENEQDHDKLLALSQQILRFLAEREDSSRQHAKSVA